MKILVINGPNINMLGVREPEIYGDKSYKALKKLIKDYAREKKIGVKLYQSNHEGDIVTEIQKSLGKYDGIVINPAAYTHTSVAILDALKAVNIPAVEVHISAVNEREDFRQISFAGKYCFKIIAGQGFKGYTDAIDALISKVGEKV